jgi:hypothetical protein
MKLEYAFKSRLSWRQCSSGRFVEEEIFLLKQTYSKSHMGNGRAKENHIILQMLVKMGR